MQVGYTVADVIAKAAFGVLIYVIAVRKSEHEPAVVESTGRLAAAE